MIVKRLMGLFVGLMLASMGMSCSDSPATARTCAFDTDCELGAVCQLTSKTCIVVACTDDQGNRICLADQVCLVTAANPAGTCSAPQCTTNTDCPEGNCIGGLCTDAQCNGPADCPPGQSCNLANQCVQGDGTCTSDPDCPSGQACVENACVPGCQSNAECADTQYCSSSKVCTTGCRDTSGCGTGQDCRNGMCVCTPGSCGDGKTCNTDSGRCEDITSCAQVTCPGEQVCNPVTLGCQERCTMDSCLINEACNTATGVCEVSNCPGENPAQCQGNLARPMWDPIRCFCAECVSNDDCNVAGETCNAAGACFSCQTTCDSGTPGQCMGSTPYCIDECCVQCIGVGDCAANELCLQGTCGQPPNCVVDENVCPIGTSCNTNTGQCTANQGGQPCDPMDPTSCPDGTFCVGGTCSSEIGGSFGCGLCNPDCTCDGGLTCDGFFCGGCCAVSFGGVCVTDGVPCPGGGTCLPGELLGLPNFCF